ncbi:hypothetical protein K504DRAFT_506295 [Pleomassaria siparia CBS 279.74]|uniref:Uncharacterized protein n=1 Tax=Pleomassaria siparia CBS 279.74 TaxID=1314801 RepID=A0A6G1JYR5_9PLEO|nr:hypothetical protein K504DRAFT_506295 [Pleomassaria siparia CBS 279.74]
MDIRKWLDDTVLPDQPPSPPEQLGLSSLLRQRAPQPSHRGKRTRRRSTSDSSLLEIRPRGNKVAATQHKVNVEEPISSNSSSSTSHSLGSSLSSQQYVRRPRRKTRPECYDPTAKDVGERVTHAHRRLKDESKRTKRKRKPGKVKKQGSGIVQSFRAKNVPTDRLTLKPREKLGIFNKGRASSPVKGRGLPDLVFSEMRFLQNYKDQPEDVPKAGLRKKKHKKDCAHARQEEISAYFTGAPLAPAEKDVNTQAKRDLEQKGVVQTSRYERDTSLGIDNAISTVEPADKASHSGFGNRGLRHESGSYISWSESIRAPSVTPIHVGVGSTIDAGQLDTMQGEREGGNTNVAHVSHLRTAPHPPVTRHTTTRSGGPFDASSLAPAKYRSSRSHSYPPHVSSPRLPMNSMNRALKSRAVASAVSASSMPPSIPHHSNSVEGRCRHTHMEEVVESHKTVQATEPSRSDGHRRDCLGVKSIDKSEGNANTPRSPSLGKVLQECESTFNRRRGAIALDEHNYRMPPPPRPGIQRQLVDIGLYRPSRRIGTVRFGNGGLTPGPLLPNFSSIGIYEEQERRQQYARQTEAESCYLAQVPCSGDFEYREEHGEMEYDGPEWEGSRAEMQSHVLGLDMLERDFSEMHEEESEKPEERGHVVSRGFWRPNKLY